MSKIIPTDGYIIPEYGFAYRATVVAYMKRQGITRIEHKNGSTYTLRELTDALIGSRNYTWAWEVRLNGELVGSGVREMTEGQLYDEYNTTNLDGLIERWNNAQVPSAPDGSPNIQWTYKRI